MQSRLIDELGQPIVIDNRPGAAGNIAVEIVARAPADGYTVLFGNVGTIAINPALFRDFPVDTVRDLMCVSIIADVASMLTVHSSVPASTVEEFIRFGFPEFQVDSWQGIYVPAGTPAPIVAKLRAAIIKVVDDQRVLDTLRNGGAEVMNKAALEECADFTRQQVKFWARLVKQVGLAGKQ